MRQKTINFVFDKILWNILYFLPILIMLISAINSTPLDLISTMNLIGINISESNVIYTSLLSIFGSGGYVELFSSTAIFYYLTYFVSCYMCHFILDILLFAVKLCRKWLDSVVGGVE